MVRLLLDTTGQSVSLAISKRDEIIFNLYLNTNNNISEKLIDIIEQSFILSPIKKENIDEIIVVIGPGSFTGIRVGVATMQGLSMALSKPLYGLSTLDAFALSRPLKYQKVALKLRGKEYVCREYDFSTNKFSDYYSLLQDELTEDIAIIKNLQLHECLKNDMLTHFQTSPVPFYFKKSEAELKFDKACC